jgi:hypothetical protein
MQSLESLQPRLLLWLGRMGGAAHVLADAGAGGAGAAWDIKRRLRMGIPFPELKNRLVVRARWGQGDDVATLGCGGRGQDDPWDRHHGHRPSTPASGWPTDYEKAPQCSTHPPRSRRPCLPQTPQVYLDELLPRVAAAAELDASRASRVAACELLHGLTLWMIGGMGGREGG